jgi:hypothetical protein
MYLARLGLDTPIQLNCKGYPGVQISFGVEGARVVLPKRGKIFALESTSHHIQHVGSRLLEKHGPRLDAEDRQRHAAFVVFYLKWGREAKGGNGGKRGGMRLDKRSGEFGRKGERQRGGGGRGEEILVFWKYYFGA